MTTPKIDNLSKQKAYDLWDRLDDMEPGSVKCLQQIHAYIFGSLYDFACQIRTKNIAKGGFQFAMAQYLPESVATIERMPETTLEEIVDKYVEMNRWSSERKMKFISILPSRDRGRRSQLAHPFMEGNGRSTRIWLDMMLKRSLKRCVDWSQIDKTQYMDAMVASVTDSTQIKTLILGALTDRIDDREMFMKGIDYSYYYEQ